MRTPRIIGHGTSYYHVMSRTTAREFLFRDVEKECFRSMMHRLAAFSGINVLTYCIMDNHFHILLEVPEQDILMEDAEIIRRMRSIYGRHTVKTYGSQLERARAEGNVERVSELRSEMMYRMENLSEFMKALKQRYSVWYNQTHDRKGTLWEERFKSVLIEPPVVIPESISSGPCVLMTIANYIDLNPVRAKIVDDPKDYRWCGCAGATAGKKQARKGLCRLLELKEGHVLARGEVLTRYRRYLYLEGNYRFPPDKVEEVIRRRGKLAPHELIRCHVRYFNDGLVIGSRKFVDSFHASRRELFGPKRRNGARHIQGQSWDGICAVRDLKKEAVSAP
jgi:REP element-mobilizing transposase RayT